MAHTPKPVRKAIKERQHEHRKDDKKHGPSSFGKRNIANASKRTVKEFARKGAVSKKGKLKPHLHVGK